MKEGTHTLSLALVESAQPLIKCLIIKCQMDKKCRTCHIHLPQKECALRWEKHVPSRLYVNNLRLYCHDCTCTCTVSQWTQCGPMSYPVSNEPFQCRVWIRKYISNRRHKFTTLKPQSSGKSVGIFWLDLADISGSEAKTQIFWRWLHATCNVITFPKLLWRMSDTVTNNGEGWLCLETLRH